jgi:hypothetical protein
MVPAFAIAGAKTAAAAAPRKAFLEWDSAFKTEVLGVLVEGAKAAADPIVARIVKVESFIFISVCHDVKNKKRRRT